MKTILSCLVLAATVAACGNDPAVKSADVGGVRALPSGTLMNTKLGAIWRSGCVDQTVQEYQFYTTGLVAISHEYGDANCTQLYIDQMLQTNVVPIQEEANVFSASAGSASVVDVIAVPRGATLVTGLNQSRSCGISDWSLDTPRSLLRTQCFNQTLTDTTLTYTLSADGRTLTERECVQKNGHPECKENGPFRRVP